MEQSVTRQKIPRVAVVHDWLTVFGGAERVLAEILDIWPQADVYSVIEFLSDDDRKFLRGKPVHTSFLQKWPFARKSYRAYLPLMALAVEQFDLSSYDLVISSSFAVAKGVITGPDQVHVSYVHSPIRYAWDLQHQYLNVSGLERGIKSWMARLMLHYVRMWDYRTAHGVDLFVANSNFISRRIRKVYGRSAVVVYPPVDVSRFTMWEKKEEFYMTASRLVEYKKVSLIVRAFSQMPSKRLVVIGDGPDLASIRAIATPNVEVLGYLPTPGLIDHMRRARAFVFAAEEDFGITPVEAQACGTPVIAYGKGGALETVIADGDNRTGVFFDAQTEESIVSAVMRFEDDKEPITAQACRSNAERFGPKIFRQSLASIVDQMMNRPAAPMTMFGKRKSDSANVPGLFVASSASVAERKDVAKLWKVAE